MSKERKLRAVVFDLDGLMFNTEELYEEVGSEILRRRDKVCTRELLDQMMGRPGRVALQIMIDFHGLEASVDQLQSETDEIFSKLLPERLQPMPGLLDLLGALEGARIPKAIATSSRRKFVDSALAMFDLAPRFEFVLSSEDVVKGKPHPEVYLAAATRLEVAPEAMMVLEDSQNGCAAAVAAGAFAVAVPGPQSTRHTYEGAQLVAVGLGDPGIYAALEITPR
mgnify:FL=1